MKAYIDTSVIISAYKPDERSHEASLHIAELKDMVKVGSYILILELISVTSRLYRASQIKLPSHVEEILSKLPLGERIYAIVNAMILDWNLSCPNLGFEVKRLKLMDFSLSMPEAILEACMMAPLIGLKTLDLIHIAYARMIREAVPDLEYFVSLDQDILNSRDDIERMTDLKTLTPQEFIASF